MKYIDTHAHLNLAIFQNDVADVVNQCSESEVTVINVGTKLSTSDRAVDLAQKYANCYAIVGLHPIQTVPGQHDEDEIGPGGNTFLSKGEGFVPEAFRQLVLASEKVVGIGECGFDYWHCPPDSYAVQEAAFISQIELANELALPLMIHTRGPKKGDPSPTGRSVYADVYQVLKQYAKVPFNVHFYAGTYEEAVHFIELGGTVSFTGVITFASVYEPLVRDLPLSSMHAETDCPFVAPAPYRGQRAEPWMVQEVYKKIAAIKGLDEEVVREQLIENAHRLYRII